MGTFVHAWAGDPDGAFTIAERGMQLSGRHPWLLHELLGMYLLRGDREHAEAIYAELKARAITSNVPHYSLAVAALRLGTSTKECGKRRRRRYCVMTSGRF